MNLLTAATSHLHSASSGDVCVVKRLRSRKVSRIKPYEIKCVARWATEWNAPTRLFSSLRFDLPPWNYNREERCHSPRWKFIRIESPNFVSTEGQLFWFILNSVILYYIIFILISYYIYTNIKLYYIYIYKYCIIYNILYYIILILYYNIIHNIILNIVSYLRLLHIKISF